jgi:hypothetical protein
MHHFQQLSAGEQATVSENEVWALVKHCKEFSK